MFTDCAVPRKRTQRVGWEDLHGGLRGVLQARQVIDGTPRNPEVT